MWERTVAAISTPLGEGGMGVIRISGSDAIKIADRCFSAVSGEKLSSLKGYSAAYGRVTGNGGETIDDCVALVFKAPKSYTGEDVVELSVHGGTAVLRETLRRVIDCGAHLAEGGEFTKRAFLNGKLDLAKAESIIEIIRAKSNSALKVTRTAKDGRVSRKIEEITDILLQTAASLSAFADYPDEDIPELSFENFSALCDKCHAEISALLSSYDTGKIIREGINCCIVGKPNVGKSTLMNLLCGNERSIVTDIAGTTRDVIESTVSLGDITLNLWDTAGIHETEDTVEKFGVEKALETIRTAQLILAVFDGSNPLDKEDYDIIDSLKGKDAIIILNKSDLGANIGTDSFKDFEVLEMSAKTQAGFNLLRQKIEKVCKIANIDSASAILVSERQWGCAKRALDAVCSAKSALSSGVTLDAVGVCIDDAVAAMLELTGKRVTEEVTNQVFSRFCVGK